MNIHGYKYVYVYTYIYIYMYIYIYIYASRRCASSSAPGACPSGRCWPGAPGANGFLLFRMSPSYLNVVCYISKEILYFKWIPSISNPLGHDLRVAAGLEPWGRQPSPRPRENMVGVNMVLA